MNSLSVSRTFYEFSIYFANSLSFSEIHYLFRVNTKIQSLILWKSLSFLTFIRCFHFDSREFYRVVSFWPWSKFIRLGTLCSFQPEKFLICPSWTSGSPYIWFSLRFPYVFILIRILKVSFWLVSFSAAIENHLVEWLMVV